MAKMHHPTDMNVPVRRHHLLPLLLLPLFLLPGCVRNRQAEKTIVEARQFLADNPDSALSFLDSLKEDMASWPKSQQMEYKLVYAQAQNKAFVPFTTDSVVLEVANYYERHGSECERMMAYYMAGCAYRDMGDAPSALKYMNMAVESAGNKCKEADLSTLMRIHSQMGGLYQDVASFENECREDCIAEQLAWQMGDTVSAIQLMWLRACGMYDRHLYDHALSLLDSIDWAIQKNRREDMSFLTFPIRIQDLLKKRNKAAAARLLCDYEKKTGVHPDSTEGSVPKLFYFLYKGQYYILAEQADSARLMFQKLLSAVNRRQLLPVERLALLEEAYHGQMEAASLLQQADSAIKYANLYCRLNDSTTLKRASEQLLRMQSLYNYAKAEQQALANEKELSRLRVTILFVAVVSLLFILVMWILYRRRKRIEKEKQIRANRERQRLTDELAKSENELNLHKTNAKRFQEEKEKEIMQLKNALSAYEANSADEAQWNVERIVTDSAICRHLHSLSAKGEKATVEEFTDLSTMAKNAFPQFFAAITKEEYGLTDREIIFCLLIRLHFIPSEIAVLNGISSQRATNIKTAINKKLFGANGAKTLEAQLLSLTDI